jgi:hypothetical protein
MAIPTSLERVDYGSSDGSILTGNHRQIISGVGATRTLLPGESGALCMLDKADGMTWTLPTPKEGAQFEFFTNVGVSGGTIKVVTNSASVFLIGNVLSYTVATASPAGFNFNGTTHVAIAMQTGGTYGGLVGTRFTVTAISTTQWLITGVLIGSGSLVTPAATS